MPDGGRFRTVGVQEEVTEAGEREEPPDTRRIHPPRRFP
jgi:hypothetical protein